MAFPSLASITTSEHDHGETDSPSPTLPAHSAGDVIVVWSAFNEEVGVTIPTGGWTLIRQQSNGECSMAIAAKVAESSSETLTYSVDNPEPESQSCTHIAAIVEGGRFEDMEANSVFDNTNSPNPPSLTPAAGADDILWVVGFMKDRGPSTQSWPTGYDDDRTSVNGNTTPSDEDTGVAIATRQLNAATENPSAFSQQYTEQTHAFTMAIYPAVPDARVTQVTVEGLTTQESAEVTQVTVEALTTQMSARVTEITVEALFPEEGLDSGGHGSVDQFIMSYWVESGGS